jgi:Recombination endonuclease VII
MSDPAHISESTRIPRKCTQCDVDIELGSKKRLCPTCRATPNPRCKKCKKVKPLSRFSHDSSRPSGYFPWCMDCQIAGVRSGAWQNPEDELNGHICPMDDVPIRGHRNRRFCSNTCKDRTQALQRKYGLTVPQFRALVESTGGECPICKNHATQWHVDHNHTTRLVMGVVCSACNVGALADTYHDADMIRRLLLFITDSPASQLGIESYAPEGSDHPSNFHKTWGYKSKKGNE